MPGGRFFDQGEGTVSVGPISASDPALVDGSVGSGVDAGASQLLGSIDTSMVGMSTVTFTAVDIAGNQTTKSCDYSVGKAVLTVTASSPAAGHYGDPVPAINPQYSGFVLGEGPTNLTTQPTCDTVYTAGDAPGDYATNCSGGVSDNYSFQYVAGNFHVGKAPLTITASSPDSGHYGDAVPPISPQYSGFVSGDGPTNLTTQPTCDTVYTAGDAPGDYATNCLGGISDNYSFQYVAGNFHVGKAALTITASSPAGPFVYGDAAPGITADYSGFVLGQNTSVLSGTQVCDTAYAQGDVPGDYRTSCSGYTSTNYEITYVDGSITVGKAPLTITASSPAGPFVYGDAAPGIIADYSGFVLGQDADVLTGTQTCDTAYAQGDIPGIYATSCSGYTSINYEITYVDGSITVGKAPLTITASSPAGPFVYGDPTPSILPIYHGFVLGEHATDLTTAPTCGTVYTAGNAPGDYATTCSGGVSTNYEFTYVPGSLHVDKAALTVTASSPTDGFYGDPIPGIAPMYTGFVLGEDESVITDPPTCSTTYTQGSGPGDYPTTCSGGSNPDYEFSYVPGNYHVGKATLTVTADNKSKVLNASNPALTFTYSGFVLGEGSSVIDTQPTCSTSATQSSPVGSYPITCSGGLDNNYTFSYVAGTLTIVYAPAGTACLGSPGHQILQPINPDGSSVFKQGSTIPAKFRVCDANGVSIGTPGVVSSFWLVTIVGSVVLPVDEAVDSTTPDAAFRWDPSAQQWIFNMSSKKLAAGKTYVYEVTLNDGSTIRFQFGLR